jgi:hypothetical protein
MPSPQPAPSPSPQRSARRCPASTFAGGSRVSPPPPPACALEPGGPANTRPVETEEERRRRRSTANRVLTTLKAMLNFAVAEGAVPRAMVDAWQVGSYRQADAPKVPHLERDEAVRLLRCLDQDPDLAALIEGALHTGCRYGELRRMNDPLPHGPNDRSRVPPPGRSLRHPGARRPPRHSAPPPASPRTTPAGAYPLARLLPESPRILTPEDLAPGYVTFVTREHARLLAQLGTALTSAPATTAETPAS